MKLEIPPGYELRGQALVPKNPHPTGEKDGWGEVIGLSVGLTAWAPDGGLITNVDRKSKSFTRWFGRICRGFFNETSPANVTVKDYTNADWVLRFYSGNSGGPRLVPLYQGYYSNPSYGYTGASLAIGTGLVPPGEESNFYNLKASYATFDAKFSVLTTTEDTSKIEYTITEGVTITASGGINCSEVALFSRMSSYAWSSDSSGDPIMLAYDEISPVVPVPAGGVIAPRYTITFTA